jgi:hypothetical protein
MTWDNRIKSVREPCPDLLGLHGWRWRVLRTSNAYRFNDPDSESDFQRGTETQDLDSSPKSAAMPKKELNEELAEGFARIWDGLQRKADAKLA